MNQKHVLQNGRNGTVSGEVGKYIGRNERENTLGETRHGEKRDILGLKDYNKRYKQTDISLFLT